MQEKKIDKNQIIGFALMFVIFLGYYFLTKPTPEEIEAQKQEQLIQEQKQKEVSQKNTANSAAADFSGESTDFDTTPTENFILENDKILLKFSSKGAQLVHAELKNYNAYDEVSENHQKPLLLIDNQNSTFGFHFTDTQGRKVDLSKRNFKALKNGNTIIFSTQENGGQIQYEYTLKNDFDLDFNLRSQGFNKISPDKTVDLNFTLHALSQEKGKSWEERYTEFYYSLNNYNDVDYTSSSFEAKAKESVDWIAFKQQFFSTILEKEQGFKNVKIAVEEAEDSIYSKTFTLFAPISVNGELNEQMQWHFLPLDYYLLKDYKKDFQEIIPFGWGFFGWINEWIILPSFKFMATWGLKYGWVIALLTVFIKLITSPIMYRQYRQSAMMKVLKPDMEEINQKYKGQENTMKRQQETMKLYRTAGVNPMAGCLPALLQIPIFYALFNFFPNVIDLRGKSFLWATDLTAYDSILDLPFNIPFYGDHVSLFALLYVVTMILYFRISGNMISAPQQEGMPDMRKLMMIMPIFFIFFLNSYASGLSLYYFVSNAINIGLVFLIKNVFIDDEKIHAKIQANKKNPRKKKKSKWAQKLDEAMRQAQEQQRIQNEMKNKKTK